MADPAFIENPWSAQFWNLTRQGEYVKKYGVDRARRKAKEAGSIFGATKPPAAVAAVINKHTVIVQRRFIGSAGLPADTPLPRGYAGDGPPDEFVADNA